MSQRIFRGALWGLFVLSFFGLSMRVAAQPLPSVANFVSNLDVRCYQIPNQPPLNVPLQLDHLNPVLKQMGLPPENVIVQQPQQLCVPVVKNNMFPPPDTVPFIQYLDWKCYGISGPPINVPLQLNHLNPVIVGLFGPVDNVILREPQQLCVPVAKNGKIPPPDVLKLVQEVDVKCYRVDAQQPIPNTPIQLTHLNPLFAGIPPQGTTIVGPRAIQLCVPVAKNQRIPPPEVLHHVEFSDVLCYRLQGPALNQQLTLQHLNPVLRQMGLPQENVPVTITEKLCVPVAKNGMFPPP
jgi:spore maturation protein SpmB